MPNDPAELSPKGLPLKRIVPEHESAREGTITIRSSSSAGAGFSGDPLEPLVGNGFHLGVLTCLARIRLLAIAANNGASMGINRNP
jgi:hypothetical protein